MNDAAGGSAKSARLRISYLVQQFPVLTETFAVSDIAALLAQGHEVTVYTMKRPRRNEEELCALCRVPAQVRIHRPSVRGAMSWPKLVWRCRKIAAWLVREIVRKRGSNPVAAIQSLLCIPRIIEIADGVTASGSDVAHAFWSRHVALVLPVLKMESAPPLRSAFVGAYDLVADDFLVDMAAGAAEVLFSHAEVNRPYLERKAARGALVRIVHRGIPLAQIREPKRDRFCWITASALTPSKNVEGVIRAFAASREREPRLRLEVYGEGADRARLEGLVRELGCFEAVIFGGHVARDELFDRMERASLFILLSKKDSERLPNVVKEALWAGCAVIASRSEGIEELIPDSSIGFVVDPDDQEAVTAAISSVLSEDAERSAARREQARAWIAKNFSSEGGMRAYVDAWNEALPARALVPA